MTKWLLAFSILFCASPPATQADDKDLKSAAQGESASSLAARKKSGAENKLDAVTVVKKDKALETAQADSKKSVKSKPGVPIGKSGEAKPNDGSSKKSSKPKAPAVSIFEDKNLEEAVRREVLAKRDNDLPITKEDVANISRVVGSHKGIRSLAGLEHCKRIMLLELAGNEISNLKPLKDLKLLQSVTLAKNRVSDLAPMAGLTSMQLLDISDNQITSISAISRMSNLRTLYISGNRIDRLEPLQKLTKIWSIDASDNLIKDISPVSGLNWLSTLNIAGNQVESLSPLKDLGELDMLMIDGNKISDLRPLVDMCEADMNDKRRFAPYLNVYLGGNPISAAKKTKQIDALKSFGVGIHE